MPDVPKKPSRSWQDIFREACAEKDPDRLLQLTEEMNLALQKALDKKLRVGA